MTAPVDFYAFDWTVLHGDTAAAPERAPLALLTGDGEPINLADWTVRAQVRGRAGELLHTFVRDVGIVLGTGAATFADDRPPIVTSTLRLRLLPGDFAALARRVRGAAYDVEISRGDTVRTVMGGAFEVVEDVTRA